MAAAQPRAARLLKSFAMPVDPAVFNGIPSVTALKPLPTANVLLAAAMDRRIVSCDLAAEAPPPTTGQKTPSRVPAGYQAWAHDKWVHDLAIHPDGIRVATGGLDRRIRIWKWGQEQPLADFPAHDDWVRAVTFSPDGSRLASAGDDGRVRLWDVDTAKGVATFETRSGFLDAIAWSVDGQELLAAGHDGVLYGWNVEQRKIARSIDIDNRRNIEDEPLNGGFSYPGGIRGLACSPDGKHIAAVGLTSLHVADLASGQPVVQLAGRGFGVAFDTSSRYLAFSQEKNILVWDFQAGQVSRQIVVDQLGLFDICFLKGGQQLAAGGCNGWVGVWDLTA